LREKFRLNAQKVIPPIGDCRSVEDSPRVPTRLSAKPKGAITYDQRLLSFEDLDRASITTLKERLRLRVGSYKKERLEERKIRGQAGLVNNDGRFFLYAVADVHPRRTPFGPRMRSGSTRA